MVVWLFRLYGCFLLGSTEHKVRFTLGSGDVESDAQLLGRSAGTVPAGRQMLPSGKRRLVYPNYDSDYLYYNPLDEMFSDLRSGAGQSIMSAVAGGFHGFLNKKNILNVSKLFVEFLSDRGVSVQWGISEESLNCSGVTGTEVLSCSSTCIVGVDSFSVVFSEDVNHTLFVTVDGIQVLSVSANENFSVGKYWQIYNALGVYK